MAGFNINASDATRLMAELAATHALLVAAVQRDTEAAGRRVQASARDLATSRSMPHLAGSIGVRSKKSASGVEVTVEARDKLGYIREFGAGRSGPHPFMLPALEQHLPAWEQAMSAALARVL